jgi:hypothetical protein
MIFPPMLSESRKTVERWLGTRLASLAKRMTRDGRGLISSSEDYYFARVWQSLTCDTAEAGRIIGCSRRTRRNHE